MFVQLRIIYLPKGGKSLVKCHDLGKVTSLFQDDENIFQIPMDLLWIFLRESECSLGQLSSDQMAAVMELVQRTGLLVFSVDKVPTLGQVEFPPMY